MQRINSPPNHYILEIRLQKGSVTSAGPRGKGRLMSKSLESHWVTGQNWEKMIDLTSKLSEIKGIEHNKSRNISSKS